ncbi:MAG: DUF952 domain-containing protein [Ignavibacteriaceae bacterium]|jgi:uncharacterized protein (DUF952 family)
METPVKNEYTALSLKSEGFIHCSTLKQTADTANIFFRGQNGLALLCIDENKLKSECKYEDPTGGGRHDPGVGHARLAGVKLKDLQNSYNPYFYRLKTFVF